MIRVSRVLPRTFAYRPSILLMRSVAHVEEGNRSSLSVTSLKQSLASDGGHCLGPLRTTAPTLCRCDRVMAFLAKLLCNVEHSQAANIIIIQDATAHMAPSTVAGLSNLQNHLALVSNRPRARDIPTLTKALRAQATNCVRFSAENNDLLEFLGDRLVNLITALIVEEVKVDKCHHTVRLLVRVRGVRGVRVDAIRGVGSSLRRL